MSFIAAPRVLGSKEATTIVTRGALIPTPGDKIGFSVASEDISTGGGSRYFVQYLLAGESALFYLTIEGRGNSASIVEQFDSYVATQKWDN